MSVLRNVNFLLDTMKIPCQEPDILIFIKTGFKAGAPALLQLFVPGCSEIMQARIGIDPLGGAFEPLIKGGVKLQGKSRRGRHGRGVSAPIKKIFPGAPLGGNQFLYKIGFFTVQRVLWWWLVADVTTEFFAAWQSMIYEEQGCDLPDVGNYTQNFPAFVYTGTGQVAGLVPGFRPPCIGVTSFDIRIGAGCSANIGWTVTWQGWPDTNGPVGNAATYLVNSSTAQVYGYAKTNDPINGNKNTTGGFHRHRGQDVITQTVYQILVDAEPAQVGVQAVSGQVWVSASGFPHSSEFGCKPQVQDFIPIGL